MVYVCEGWVVETEEGGREGGGREGNSISDHDYLTDG